MSIEAEPLALSVRNLSAGYSKNEMVIEDIELFLKKGEFFGLIGLNGVGKTTLIKTILSLRNKNKGEIKIFGNDSNSLEAKKRISYLPERFEPSWFLTGEEYIKFSLSLYEQPYNKDYVLEQVDKLALDRKALKRKVQTYSKGMRQKLGILGTVLTNCDLLILDEPMSGLDPSARTLVKDMLLNYKSNGHSVLLCSHILADLDELCDSVAILNDKKIQFSGSPASLKKKTNDEYLERAFLSFVMDKCAA
tara:strand:- start:156 stop:902 length:747 start_codon:yes stop_codon:yes gene_type:complete